MASIAYHKGCKYLCGSNHSSLAPITSTRPPPPLPPPQEIPFTSRIDVNLPIRFHIPVKVLVLPPMEAVLHSPAGHRTASNKLMVENTPTLPTYQCVGYPAAPIPGWLASILPFNPCVGCITPPLLMALMPVHPALAGKWLQKKTR